MNEELDFLKKEGWILSESGLKTIDLNGSARKNISKVLLDRDLREIGAGISDLHKGKFENIEHDLVVLQILKLRNISAPKSNEMSKTAPKLMKLQLTDGQNTYSAIEMEPTALTLETRPGTKISLKVKQLKYANGQLLLTPKNMEILGGYVESLVSKWEISRSLATQMKGNRSGTAPPFIPFGQKIQQNLPNDRSFKSLQQNKQKEGEDNNSEFNAQRQDAIAEASKAATRKTFGGGNKTLVDSNVQKIMDKGYSEEQATVALKYAKNNVEKALSNLKRRDERQQRANSHDYDTRESSRDYNNKRGSGKGGNNSSEPPLSKPSTGVSLFDFLENKIPETTSTTTNVNTAKSSSYAQNNNSNNNNNERFENNISSSFRKHDKENSNKSQQWSQYSSSNEQKSSQNYQKNSYNARNNDYRNQESSSKEHSRDYKDYRHKDSRDGPRDRERDSKYQSQHHSSYQSSNYSSKPNTSSSNAYPKSSQSTHSASHKPSSYSSSSNAGNNGSQNSYNNSASNKGKYSGNNKPEYSGQKSDYSGQKSDYSGQKQDYASHKPEYNGSKPDYNNRDGGKNPSKDYNKDYNKDYHKDYNKDYSKDYNKDYSKDYNKDYSKDYSKDYNNYSSSGANNSNYNSKYDKPPRSNNVSSHNNSSSMSHHQHQSHSNDMYQKPQRNIVESMEKMNLKGNHHQQQSYKSYDSSYESKSSSYPPLVSSNETKQNYSKTSQSNYPIVGFQSKEGNEQAKNALKTKNIPGNMPQSWQQQQQQQQPPAQKQTPQQVPIPVPVISQQTIKGPPPPFSSNSVPQNAPNQPPTMHSIQPPPQPFVQHQVMHAMPQGTVLTTSNPPPTVYHAAPINYPGQIIMQSVQPPQIQQVPPPTQLKVGDLCLAKYWEDGKFYNAKITGNSDSTYVVLFTEYGNAEEVRKSDCVPLISVPTCPTPPQAIPNFVQPPQMSSYRISSQQKMPPPPQQHNYHSQQGMPYKAAGKNPRRN